jgi:predicted type IV restriction endonuclease
MPDKQTKLDKATEDLLTLKQRHEELLTHRAIVEHDLNTLAKELKEMGIENIDQAIESAESLEKRAEEFSEKAQQLIDNATKELDRMKNVTRTKNTKGINK